MLKLNSAKSISTVKLAGNHNSRERISAEINFFLGTLSASAERRVKLLFIKTFKLAERWEMLPVHSC